jgi:cyclopropane-fatty-acyl-phospholipid synthase
MADKGLGFTYSTIEALSMWQTEITGPIRWRFSMSQSPNSKIQLIADGCILKGRVLDRLVAGAFLQLCQPRKGAGFLLLSQDKQMLSKNGLNVVVKDCRYVKSRDFGIFMLSFD